MNKEIEDIEMKKHSVSEPIAAPVADYQSGMVAVHDSLLHRRMLHIYAFQDLLDLAAALPLSLVSRHVVFYNPSYIPPILIFILSLGL